MAKKLPIRVAETGDLFNPTNVWYNLHSERVPGDFANSICDLPGSNRYMAPACTVYLCPHPEACKGCECELWPVPCF